MPNATAPRWLTKATPAEQRRGDGDRVVDLIDSYARITKETVAGKVGERIQVRPWQRSILRQMFARRTDGRRKFRQALIGVARKNGKSALGSGVALFGLLAEGDGAEVYSCAADRDQARIVFGTAKRMVELDEELSAWCKCYRDVIEVPSTGSVYRALSAEAYTKEGLSPTLVVFDEVHAQPDDELWNVMNLGSGARIDPLVLGITTAGSRTDSLGRDSLCYRLYQHGRRVAAGEVPDPSFFFAWWEPRNEKADHADPKTWRQANPGLGDLCDPEDFASLLPRTPEAEYRTKRCNQWVVASESALPHGAWDACPVDTASLSGCVLVVDGSWNGDCTGIIAVTPDLRVQTVGCWEAPPGDLHWRVPIEDVKATVREQTKTLAARWVIFDPYRWQATMAELEAEGLPIMEFPAGSVARMVPAWKQFYDAVLDRRLSHDGDPRLARHVENMRLKIDASGARPVKEHKMSGRHIDLGICAVIGVACAAIEAPELVSIGYYGEDDGEP